MAARYILAKAFSSFKGLDLRSGDLLRTKEFASELRNCDFRATSALSKRKGYQTKAEGVGGGGVFTYANLNKETGEITEELMVADSTLRHKEEATLAISYSGSDIGSCTILPNEDGLLFELFDGDTLIASQNLGNGFESIPVTLTGLETTINATTDFTAVVTGEGTIPAAFISQTNRTEINTSTPFSALRFIPVNSPQASPFALHWAAKDTPAFELATAVNTKGVLYISNGYDPLHKYDGQNLYRASLPQPEPIAASILGAAGDITNSDLKYRVAYYNVDAKGNIVEGTISFFPTTGLAATNNRTEVTVPMLEAATGFNTNCAIVNGAQTGVTTITVDSGHTMKVGDTAYFFDGVSSDYVTREVEAITATTIQIAGTAINVADNAVISNNLRVDLYRNIAGGTTYYLLESFPNNSFVSSVAYEDNSPDADLGEEYIEPVKLRGIAPKGKYMTLFRGQLIISGFTNDVDNVAYSDVDSPEYFPDDQNRFLVGSVGGDKITGIKALNSVLFVFKDNSIYTLTGDLVLDNFRVDILTTGGIGCASNQSIQEINGQLFFLDKTGVFAVSPGADGVQEVSELIKSEFDPLVNSFNYKRAVAAHWILRDKYVLYMPETEVTGGKILANNNSLVYAYDVFRQAWLIWDSINALGGFSVLERNLWNCAINETDNFINEFHNTGTLVDYADHISPIQAYYKTHWETLGEPSLYKKFLRLKLHSLDAAVDNFETELFTIKVTCEKDFNDIPVYEHIFDFGNGASSAWGENPWGIFPWGDSRLPAIVTKLKVNKAQSMRLIFENVGLNENFLLSGYEFEVAAPFQTAIKE